MFTGFEKKKFIDSTPEMMYLHNKSIVIPAEAGIQNFDLYSTNRFPIKSFGNDVNLVLLGLIYLLINTGLTWRIK